MIKTAVKGVYTNLPFKRQLFEPLRRLGLPERLYRHLHFSGPFYVSIEGNRGFMIEHRGSIVENELFWSGLGGGWEGKSNQIWAALCADRSGIILDVGANSGVYSLVAAAVAARAAKIIAFEPIERVADLLRHNVALNGNRILVEQVALSDSDGTATIYDFAGDAPYSASIERAFPGADTHYEVPTLRADSFLQNFDDEPLDACKIDVEGHEAAVLRGMRSAIDKWGPPLLLEVLDEQAGARVADAIEGATYGRWNIDEARGLVPAKKLRPLSEHNWNMLLCTQEDFDARNLGHFIAR